MGTSTRSDQEPEPHEHRRIPAKGTLMSPKRAPFATLDDVLRQTWHLLIDFDGPICSLFAGTTTASVADRLRAVIMRREGPLPTAIENTADWFEIFAYAASVGPDVGASVEAS